MWIIIHMYIIQIKNIRSKQLVSKNELIAC